LRDSKIALCNEIEKAKELIVTSSANALIGNQNLLEIIKRLLIERREVTEAVKALQPSILRQGRDMSLDHRDAWIYGILIGWDVALPEILKQHSWAGTEYEDRLKKHQAVIAALTN